MQNYSDIINILLGIGVVFMQIFALVLLSMLLFYRKKNPLLDFVKAQYLLLGFLVSFCALVFSLFYSEVMEYLPCYHCWIQRIFLIPQAILFAVALLRKEANVFFYSMPLLVLGFVDSLYHNYLYYLKPDTAPCDASGVSCVQRVVSVFDGYVSIPSMSLTVFAFLIVISLVSYYYKK